MTKNRPKTICMNHIAHSADDSWRPTRLRRAFGAPLPQALAAHRDDTGAVPVHVVQRYIARLHREALRAFDQHSELILGTTEQPINGQTAQKGTNP